LTNFDKYADELEQDLAEGVLTEDEFRRAMRELIEEFNEDEDSDDY